MAPRREWLAVACGTHARPSLTALGAHCGYWGIPLYVGQYGKDWKGFFMKLQTQDNVARNVKPDTMLIFLDAYDVIMNGPIEAIEDQYEKMCPNGEILAQQDVQCHPNHSLEPVLRQKYPKIDKPFINAGVLIGPARRFKQIFDSFPWKTFTDDQGYWNQVWAD